MMAREVVGELVARELVARHDAVHHSHVLEYDEVPVHGALREAAPSLEDLRDRQRPVGGGEHVDQLLTTGGEALLPRPQPSGRPIREARVTARHHDAKV